MDNTTQNNFDLDESMKLKHEILYSHEITSDDGSWEPLYALAHSLQSVILSLLLFYPLRRPEATASLHLTRRKSDGSLCLIVAGKIPNQDSSPGYFEVRSKSVLSSATYSPSVIQSTIKKLLTVLPDLFSTEP